MQPRYVTYFTRLGSELITVQNFPAYICDMCGRREYDEQSIYWLDAMLDPNAGKPTSSSRRTTPLPRRQTGFSHPMQDS
jgi:YgiT-type zinc finger domain-containing protein